MNKVAFILGIACIVLSVLYFRSCQKGQTSPTELDKKVDSIVQKAIADTILYKRFADSLASENALVKIQRDSLQHVLDLTKGSLRGKDKDIQALIANINTSEAANNQTAALAACDSLKAAYPIAKGLVTQYINTNDSLKRETNILLANKDTLIGRLSGLYQETNNSLFETSRLYGIVTQDNKTLLKQSKKRWGIGPGFGATVVDGKVRPVLNFSIHYDLFKF